MVESQLQENVKVDKSKTVSQLSESEKGFKLTEVDGVATAQNGVKGRKLQCCSCMKWAKGRIFTVLQLRRTG